MQRHRTAWAGLVLTVLAAYGSPAGAAPGTAAVEGRPNILFCIADDWMWPHASILGDPVVRTPTFDRVAREGVLFEHAFMVAPSCTPSRAGILSGQQPFRLGEGTNLYGPLDARYPVYPDLLEDAGYFVGFTRKGWGPGDAAKGGRARNPAGPSFKDFATFLDRRPEGNPFCFWFGSQDPHRGYNWSSGVKSGMDPDKVVVPPCFPDDPVIRTDICDYYFEVQRFDREVGELLALLEERGELDRTLVVMTGDNGWPFPRGKATLYDAGTRAPLAIRWPAAVRGGRTVTDFASLIDLAPTFLEAGGVTPPEGMTGRSLLPVLRAEGSGRIDPSRDHVVTAMERHVPCREGQTAGYPMRAIRTDRYLYIRNFKPERWAAGDPAGLEVPGAEPFTEDQLRGNTRLAFGDVDASPTKAWMILHRNDPAVNPLYEKAFGKRPARELYDVRKDPWNQVNLAGLPDFSAIARDLDARLMKALAELNDPRLGPEADQPDRYPFGGGRPGSR